MPKEMDLIKLNTIKRYVKEVKEMRLSDTSANDLRIRFNAILKSIITEATKSAKRQKRSTIMPRDVIPAVEYALGKKALKPRDVYKAIDKLNPIELGELSGLIIDLIKKEKQKRK